MNKFYSFIPINELHYQNINRKITRDDIIECLRQGFPLIYDSVNRGKGLALGVIKYLYEHGEASMYKLKKELNVELPAVRKILIRLEETGYVERRIEKSKRPRGKFLYSLSTMGSIVYHVAFTQKPYSWLIDHVLKKMRDEREVREDFIVKFLEENERLLKNVAFEELMNYLFIKHLKISLEDLFKYVTMFMSRDTAKKLFAVLVASTALTSIPAVFIKYVVMKQLKEEITEEKVFHMLSTHYMELPSLFPIILSGEFPDDVLSVLNDLTEKNIISEREVFNLIRTYLKYLAISMQLNALYSSTALLLSFAAQKNPSINTDDLNRRIMNALDAVAEIIKIL